MSGVIENMTANIEDLRNEVAELKRKVKALEKGEVSVEVSTTFEERVWSPQKERDAIVERAKADIEALKNSVGRVTERRGYLYERAGIICDAEFIVNKEKRVVVCLVRGQVMRDIFAKGIAKCAPNDCYNVHIGKAIALRRALGLEIPSEYLNAPQPTEVRVGDILAWHHANYEPYLIEKINGNKYECKKISTGRTYYLRYNNILSGAKVIDDSREGVSE